MRGVVDFVVGNRQDKTSQRKERKRESERTPGCDVRSTRERKNGCDYVSVFCWEENKAQTNRSYLSSGFSSSEAAAVEPAWVSAEAPVAEQEAPAKGALQIR